MSARARASQEAAAFSKALETARSVRGPFYHDLTTNTLQCVSSRRVLNLAPAPAASSVVVTHPVITRDEVSYASLLADTQLARSRQGMRMFPMIPVADPTFCCGCRKASSAEELLTCNLCNNSWHPACLHISPERAAKLKGGSFNCHYCRRCESCGHACSDDRMMLMCNKCEVTCHADCAKLAQVPADGVWFCRDCVKCKGCGTALADAYYDEFRLCHACFTSQALGNGCIVCRVPDNEPALQCVLCFRFVHANKVCDPDVDETVWKTVKEGRETMAYTCRVCKPASVNAAAAEELEFAMSEFGPVRKKLRFAQRAVVGNEPEKEEEEEEEDDDGGQFELEKTRRPGRPRKNPVQPQPQTKKKRYDSEEFEESSDEDRRPRGRRFDRTFSVKHSRK